LISPPTVISASVVPARALAAIGGSVEFQCIVSSSTSENVNATITWTYPTSLEAVISNYVLRATNVTSQSAGEITCTVEVDSSDNQRTSATAFLEVGELKINFFFELNAYSLSFMKIVYCYNCYLVFHYCR